MISQFTSAKLLLRELASVAVVWHVKVANFVELIPRLSSNLRMKNVRSILDVHIYKVFCCFHPLISSFCSSSLTLDEIEKLVDKKIIYKVRWAGYGSDEDTWENAENLPERSIREFEDKWSKEQSRKGKSSKGQEKKGENGGEE